MLPSQASVGKTIRMERIFKDGAAIMIAINHGIAMGACGGLARPALLFDKMANERVDSWTMHKGMAVRMAPLFAGKASLVLKSSNATEKFFPDETPVASVEEAVRLGADAVAFGLSLYDPLERQSIERLGQLVREAEQVGMPTVAHSYPCGSLIPEAERFTLPRVSYAARVAYELGIDLIKTYWTGSAKTFEEIVRIGSPAKVVISGGPKCKTLRECYEMTYQGISAGADGITYGRNVWQHEYPAAVVRGLSVIVHDHGTVDMALEAAADAAETHLE